MISDAISFEFTYNSATDIDFLEKIKTELNSNYYSILNHNFYYMPDTYYQVTQDNIIIVLNVLISIKNSCHAKVTASPQETFKKIVNKGLEANQFTSEKSQYYLSEIPTVLSIRERENLACDQKNFVEAFALAWHYKSLFLENFRTKSQGQGRREIVGICIDATNWLASGLEFKNSTHTDLTNYINLDDFLCSLDHVRRKILHCDANLIDKKLLLDALVKNKTIVALILEEEEDLNDFVMELLKTTRSIRKIIMLMQIDLQFSSKFIERLAEVLKSNLSINEIGFSHGRTITIENFKVILNALATNPNSNVTKLRGQRVAIRKNEAAEFLISHLQNHYQLEYVEPWHYRVISNVNFNHIKNLLEENINNKPKIQRAFMTGSAQGFFAQLGLTKNLGKVMSPYLNKNDTFNLLQVSKLISQEAKAEQTIEIENLKLKKRKI